ncbi:hypothetical protein [uncultured Nostoc sp.]|uniref:hypothetical protein n=1 Tax=uncultured Nostoc sp. TaxID=340711 RepID=UPI0035CC50A1
MKIPDCFGVARLRHRCLLYSHDPHLVCAVHPAGPQENSCLDFREDPDIEPAELREPEGASYYNGELMGATTAATYTRGTIRITRLASNVYRQVFPVSRIL